MLETLKSGTVINYRNLFNDDQMLVNIKAVTACFLWKLTEASITKLTKKDKMLEKYFGQFQHQLLKKGSNYPIDLIIHEHNRKKAEMLKRRTVLKNVVTNIIQGIRNLQRMPKLQDIITMCGGKTA